VGICERRFFGALQNRFGQGRRFGAAFFVSMAICSGSRIWRENTDYCNRSCVFRLTENGLISRWYLDSTIHCRQPKMKISSLTKRALHLNRWNTQSRLRKIPRKQLHSLRTDLLDLVRHQRLLGRLHQEI
jgi:hypothetical protein